MSYFTEFHKGLMTGALLLGVLFLALDGFVLQGVGITLSAAETGIASFIITLIIGLTWNIMSKK
jgi:hypothetical protein